MLKKLICLILSCCLVLALAACNKTDNPVTPPEDTQGGEQNSNTDNNNNNTDDPGQPPVEDPGPLPSVEDYPLDQWFTQYGYFKGVNASELVKLPDYAGLEVPEGTTTASEESIQYVVDNLLSQFVEYEQLTTGTVKDGDTVNIDYSGSMNGVVFDGGTAKGSTVTIGVTSFIDGFLDQLIGHKPGENFDINVTFPDPYLNNPDFSGKDAVFNITINYIRGAEIKQELNDDIAAQLGYENKDALMAAVVETIVNNQKDTYVEDLLKQAEIESVPDTVIEGMQQLFLKSLAAEAASYNAPMEVYLNYFIGISTTDEYLALIDSQVQENARVCLAAQAIAEKENLTVTVEDIAAANYETAVDYFGMEYVTFIMLRGMVVRDFLLGDR